VEGGINQCQVRKEQTSRSNTHRTVVIVWGGGHERDPCFFPKFSILFLFTWWMWEWFVQEKRETSCSKVPKAVIIRIVSKHRIGFVD
jgi:hypothetical protein